MQDKKIPEATIKAHQLIYPRFPFIEESLTDGWVFGSMTEFAYGKDCCSGDGFVFAPDGTCIDVDWEKGTEKMSFELYPVDHQCWAIFNFQYPDAIQTTEDWVKMCHSFLPKIIAKYQQETDSK
ncbi:MAG: hypothetical protein ACF8OB_00820 [Phycisphaeraceae bacterium JB051]